MNETMTKIIDTSIRSFEGIAEILEHKPDLVGILTAHDACLEFKKTFEKVKAKIGGRS